MGSTDSSAGAKKLAVDQPGGYFPVVVFDLDGTLLRGTTVLQLLVRTRRPGRCAQRHPDAQAAASCQLDSEDLRDVLPLLRR